MNKETKSVIVSSILLVIGAAFLEFGFVPIGAALMGVGLFGVMFGPVLVNFDHE